MASTQFAPEPSWLRSPASIPPVLVGNNDTCALCAVAVGWRFRDGFAMSRRRNVQVGDTAGTSCYHAPPAASLHPPGIAACKQTFIQ